MATVYKSKIDAWLVVVLAFAIAVSLFASATILSAGAPWWAAAGVVALGAGLPLWLLFGTSYCLEADQLHVTSGPFKWHIPVAAITSIAATHNPLSSPALSLDRLRIQYGRGKAIMISPRDKSLFLEELETMRSLAE